MMFENFHRKLATKTPQNYKLLKSVQQKLAENCKKVKKTGKTTLNWLANFLCLMGVEFLHYTVFSLPIKLRRAVPASLSFFLQRNTLKHRNTDK